MPQSPDTGDTGPSEGEGDGQTGRMMTAVAVAVTLLVAACGGSSAPDVSGSPASDSATLFKASNLNKVLTQANSELGATPVTNLKIEPRDLKIIGQSKTVTIDNSGKSLVVSTPSIPGGAFQLGLVSPSTVESVVNGVESKASLKQSGIAYVAVTVDPITNKPYYGVYPVSGNGHYQANINGGNLKSVGTSGRAVSSGGTAPSSSTSGAGASNPQAMANCVSKAGTDAAKIAACTRR